MKNPACVLAGDIGGTKASLGLYVPGKRRPRARVTETFPSKDADSLETIISQMLAYHPAKIRSACFGIAGPVINGVCRTTNLPWVVDARVLADNLGVQTVELINDLEANAYGIGVLPQGFRIPQ